MMTKYWVAFSSIEQISSKFILELYREFGDIRLAFEASESEIAKIPDMNIKKVREYLALRDKVDVDKVYEAVLNRGLKILTYEDNNYPYMLKNISDPPAVLYYKGDIFGCNLEKTLAVIGSRRLSNNGKESLKRVMSGFLNLDMCVVSGLATGADTQAHLLALENNLKTIGVIGSGLDFIYPSANKKLYETIINGNGAVVSEYYPTFQPLAFRFPQRNRIVSGLSYGTLVVEAALKSGALITANLTLEQGRELMCIPGLITNPNTQGIYKLIKTGASLVTSAEDVLDAMGWCKVEQMSLFDSSVTDVKENIDLTIDEKKILYTIDIEAKSFDEIQSSTGLGTEELLTALTNLELNGCIELGLGDRYIKR